MTRSALLFIGAVVVSAFGLVYALPFDSFGLLTSHDVIGLVCFVGVGILSEGLAIDFGSGKQASSSLAFLPFLASIVVFSPIVALTGVAIVVVFSSVVLSRQEIAKALFNISQAIIAVALAGLAYSQFLDETNAASPVRSEISYLGFLILAVIFFSVNILLTSVAIALLRQQSVIKVLNQVVGPRGGNLVYDLLASPIAIVPAVLYQSQFVTGILIILLPLLLIRYSYLSKLQLEEANRDLLKVLVKAIETRDPYTSGHSVRVATLARLIARDLNLSARKVDQVETAALLHDIGKIDSIYAAVIRKPHDLSEEERDLIRTHATKGADLLETLSSVSREVVRGVRHHHERYDGTGYPSGMRADAIPISARIIMLCDSIDAMLSDRPYRRALGIGKVRSELVRCAGTQFDPKIVHVVLQRNTLERAAALAARPLALVIDDEPALTSSA
jgi:putative nucleotidyltransferase with HDIG domain